MPGFRWSVKLDIALCLEVFKTRPQKTADWEKVATSLGAETAELRRLQHFQKPGGAATFILPPCSLHSPCSDTQQPAQQLFPSLHDKRDFNYRPFSPLTRDVTFLKF